MLAFSINRVKLVVFIWSPSSSISSFMQRGFSMTINRILIFSIIIDILKNIKSSTKCSVMKWSYSKYILRVFFNNVFLYKFNNFFAPSISDNAALCSGVFPCSFLGFISSTFSLMRRKASKLPFLAAWWSGVFPSFLWFKIQSYKKLSVTKKCTPKLIFLNEKKRKIQMVFDVENWLWKSYLAFFDLRY